MLEVQTEIFILWCTIFTLISIAEGISAKLSFGEIVTMGLGGALGGFISWLFITTIFLGIYHSITWTF